MKTTRTRHERTREYLTPEEVLKLLAATRLPGASRNPERDYCIMLLMSRHGLRVSELCQMKLADVDLESKILHVHRLKASNSTVHPLYNGEPKAVASWLAARSKMRPHCDALFVSERRRPLSRCTVWLLIKNCAQAAGLEGLSIHPHMLRHACGYNLANRGADTRLIQDYLGHRSIQSTVRYTALASNRFAKLF
jgi:site-specific recombinase XerD